LKTSQTQNQPRADVVRPTAEPQPSVKIPHVIAHDVMAFRIEDTPAEVIDALMKEVGDTG
jgi:hypothetical protein